MSDSSSPFSNTETVRTVTAAKDSETSLDLSGQEPSEGSATPWLWNWNGKNTSTDTDKAGRSSGTQGPWKRYRITVEEILEDGNASSDQEVPHDTISPAAVINKTITTTTAMPSSVMDWLTSFAPQDHQTTEQMNVIPTDSKPAKLAQPVMEDLSKQEDDMEATANDKAGTGQGAKISSDNVGDMDDTLSLPSSTVDVQAQQKRHEQDVDRTTLSSAATAAATAAATVATMAAISNKTSNDNNGHDVHVKYPVDHTDTPCKSQRQWPPKRSPPSEQQQQQQQQQRQSYTRTTITRPDGTVESKTVSLNHETGQTETHIRIQRPDGSFHESIATKLSKEQHQQQSSKQQHRSTLRERLAQRRQERQERRQERQERRLQERNRTAQYDSETEKKPRPDSDSEGEARKKRLERRQELRDAEARQREATAIAYGVHPHSPSQDRDASRSNNTNRNENENENANEDPYRVRSEFHQWHSRRLRHGSDGHATNPNTNSQALREEDKEEEWTTTRPNGSWPPRAYLRRQQLEKEQGHEPRHNV
ncbi:hypothetical protein BGZ50_006660 [Haplosporangium sp. Z 11]|nr:hypothetical protein BGZ50_006660 [Haplosporangium sp. Z 11]